MEDWKATAVRLKKRWEYVHEDLVLRAVDRALEERPKDLEGSGKDLEKSTKTTRPA